VPKFHQKNVNKTTNASGYTVTKQKQTLKN